MHGTSNLLDPDLATHFEPRAHSMISLPLKPGAETYIGLIHFLIGRPGAFLIKHMPVSCTKHGKWPIDDTDWGAQFASEYSIGSDIV